MRAVFFLAALVAANAANAATLKIEQAWSPPSASPTMGVAYLTASSDAPCTIIGAAASDVTQTAELHTHLHENGVMQMRQLDHVDVTPEKPAHFAPGGLHVMLIGLKKPLRDGEQFALTLSTKECGETTTQVEISKGRLLEQVQSGKHGSQHH